MRVLISTLMLICGMAAASPALAQATAVGQHRDWGVYSYQSGNGKVCYAMSVPKEKQPASLDHGDIFFFVSRSPVRTWLQNRSSSPPTISSRDPR